MENAIRLKGVNIFELRIGSKKRAREFARAKQVHETRASVEHFLRVKKMISWMERENGDCSDEGCDCSLEKREKRTEIVDGDVELIRAKKERTAIHPAIHDPCGEGGNGRKIQTRDWYVST